MRRVPAAIRYDGLLLGYWENIPTAFTTVIGAATAAT
jgi:hypothetical protein